MKNLNKFFNNIQRSKTITLLSILLISSLIAFLTNLLFKFDSFKNIVENKFYFTIFGLAIYGIWIAVIYFFLKKDQFKLEDFGISKCACFEGLLACFYLLLIVNLIFLLFSLLNTGHIVLSEDFSSWHLTLIKLGLFTFNILIGAFIEELIFRGYLIPQLFHLFKKRIRNNVIPLVSAIIISQIIFSLFHIPVRIYRNEITNWALLQGLIQLFISGIIFSIIYLRTRNLIFVTLVHALVNFPIFFVESKISFYAPGAIILLTMLLFKRLLFRAT